MKKYEWILFDADETLFHFDAFSGLQLMFTRYGVRFNQHDYEAYQSLNKSLWLDYQNHLIVAEELQHQRFNTWASKLKISSRELNSVFMSVMAEICTPIEGAVNLLNALKGKMKLGIITNGFTELQQARLERIGLKDHFDFVVISEEVGVAKPHKDIFDHAFSLMNNPFRDRVLMVGDNTETDILGGINAGLDTCWVNLHHKSAPKNIVPSYQVSSLKELQKLLLG